MSLEESNVTDHSFIGTNTDQGKNTDTPGKQSGVSDGLLNSDQSVNGFTESVSAGSVEELSSFDLSEEEVAITKKVDQETIQRDAAAIEYHAGPELETNQTPPMSRQPQRYSSYNSTPKSQRSFSDNFKHPSPGPDTADVNSLNSTNYKHSSRISSDTFDTPKTIETRASTVNFNSDSHSNSNDYSKAIENELVIAAASVRKQPIKSSNTRPDLNAPIPCRNSLIGHSSYIQHESIPQTSKRSKRLSRQSNYDTSDRDVEDYNMSVSHEDQSIENIFPKLSLNGESTAHGQAVLPQIDSISQTAATHVVELQNQLTNCKIQIKLQNDLLRDKLFRYDSNEDISNVLEKSIMSSIKSAREKEDQDFELMSSKYEALLTQYQEASKSLEMLNEQHNDNANNQFEWQSKVKDMLFRIKNVLTVSSPAEITDFKDLLVSLSGHIDHLLNELLECRRVITAQSSRIQETQSNTTTILDSIEDYSTHIDELENAYRKKIQKLEDELNTLRTRISELQRKLDNEKKKSSVLESSYGDVQVFKKREENLRNEILALNEQNLRLQNNSTDISKKVEKLISEMAIYHSIMLKLLTRIIDPESAGNIIDACNSLDHTVGYDEMIKVFSVAHNYEIDSVTKILDSYKAIVSKSSVPDESRSRLVSELQGEIHFLTSRLKDMEHHKEREALKVHELEAENSKLRELLNERNNEEKNKTDRLEKLRFDDLVKRWKTAEEAHSQTKKGAAQKIAQLEQEIKILRSQMYQ